MTRLRFWLISVLFRISRRTLFAGFAESWIDTSRARITIVLSAAAWLAALASSGAISSTRRWTELASGNPGVTLAMIVESSSSGKERPRTLMAPLSEKGRPT